MWTFRHGKKALWWNLWGTFSDLQPRSSGPRQMSRFVIGNKEREEWLCIFSTWLFELCLSFWSDTMSNIPYIWKYSLVTSWISLLLFPYSRNNNCVHIEQLWEVTFNIAFFYLSFLYIHKYRFIYRIILMKKKVL